MTYEEDLIYKKKHLCRENDLERENQELKSAVETLSLDLSEALGQLRENKSKVKEAWIKFCKSSNVGEKEPYFVFYKTDKKRFEKELGLTSEEKE